MKTPRTDEEVIRDLKRHAKKLERLGKVKKKGLTCQVLCDKMSENREGKAAQ